MAARRRYGGRVLVVRKKKEETRNKAEASRSTRWLIGGRLGLGDLTRLQLAGFRQDDNLQVDLRTTAMPTARLTAWAGLGEIAGETVLLGRIGRRGEDLHATLQAITDSKPLERFAPCIDFRRLNLTASSHPQAAGTAADFRFAFADGFSMTLAADMQPDRRRAALTTSRFALEPCGKVAPEFGLALTGSLAVAANLESEGEAVALNWRSELEEVSLQFHDLLQAPLPVERFRGTVSGSLTEGLEGRGELALADLPIYLDLAVDGERQSVGLATRTPLRLLRLARLLSFKGLDRDQRNAVLRQVRRGRIEQLWIGADCARTAVADCFAELGRAEQGVSGHFRLADLALTPLPRAPGLSIAAIDGRLADGSLFFDIENGDGTGLRLIGGQVRLSRPEDAALTAKGEIAFTGPLSDFAAMANEALQVDTATKFQVQGGTVSGRAAIDWPKAADSEADWLTASLRIDGLSGLAGGTVSVDDAALRAQAQVSGSGEAPAIAMRIESLRARGIGWSLSGEGKGRYGPEHVDYDIAIDADLLPEVLAVLAPDSKSVRWEGGPIRLAAKGKGQGTGQASLDMTLDGGTACLDVPGDTPVHLKRCEESLTMAATLTVDQPRERYVVSNLRATLAGAPIVADGRLDLLPDGVQGNLQSGQIGGAFLTGRLPGGRIVAGDGHLAWRLALSPTDWQVDADLLQLELTEPIAGRLQGRMAVNAREAEADIVLMPEWSAIPEVRLSGTVRDLGPSPVVEAAVRIPSLEIPTVDFKPSATAPVSDEPPPVLLPGLDDFITQAPDTFVPGRGTVDLRIDSINLGADGSAAGHMEGKFVWGAAGQRATMDWVRDGQIAAGLFAEVQQSAVGASALSQLRFATSNVETALISRLLVGKQIASSGSVGLRVDLQGPWQRSLRRWSGSLELRGSDIDLTEAQLLAETIAASGATGDNAVPGVLGLRKASVRGTLQQGRIAFEPVYLETTVGTVFGRLGLSLADNGVEGLVVVGPLKDLQDFFQLLPGLHNVGEAVEALRFAVKIDGTVFEPRFGKVGAVREGEPEVVRTLQDTLRKLQSLGGAN